MSEPEADTAPVEWAFSEDGAPQSLPAGLAQPDRLRDLRPGDRFADCTILNPLGQGGMGSVFRARDSAGRKVALKIVTGTPTRDRSERIAREGQITANLHHSGIVNVHSAGIAEGRPFIVYELIQGTTLEECFETLPRETLVRLLTDVARALGYAHEHGILHRDIKAENILLDPALKPRIADFGLAHAAELERITKSGAMLGTPRTMAPEQITGTRERYGPPTDVWAMGILLYRALCGDYPFHARTLLELAAAITSGNIPPPRRVDPTVPKELEAVCLKALAHDPNDRYRDGTALAEALDQAVSAPKSHGRAVGALTLAGVGLAVAGVLIGWALAPSGYASSPPSPRSPVPPVHPTSADEDSIASTPPLRERTLQAVRAALQAGDVQQLATATRALADPRLGLLPDDEPELVQEIVERCTALLDQDPSLAVDVIEALATSPLQCQDRPTGTTFTSIVMVRASLSRGIHPAHLWRLHLASARLDLGLTRNHLRGLDEPVIRKSRPWSASPRDPWKRYLDLRLRLSRPGADELEHPSIEAMLVADPAQVPLGPRHWSDTVADLVRTQCPEDRALKLLREAQRRNPHSPVLEGAWAHVLAKLERFDEAAVHAQRSVDWFPKRARPRVEPWTRRDLLRRAVEIQAHVGERVRARRNWVQLKRIAPSFASFLSDRYPWLAEDANGE